MTFNKYYVTFLALLVVQSLVLSSQSVPVWVCGVIGGLTGLVYEIGKSRGEN